MLLPQQGPANGGQQMVVIIVTDIQRKVTVDSLEGAGAIQAASTAGPDAAFHRVFRQVLHDVARTTAR